MDIAQSVGGKKGPTLYLITFTFKITKAADICIGKLQEGLQEPEER
jgi:hypothetical protein